MAVITSFSAMAGVASDAPTILGTMGMEMRRRLHHHPGLTQRRGVACDARRAFAPGSGHRNFGAAAASMAGVFNLTGPPKRWRSGLGGRPVPQTSGWGSARANGSCYLTGQERRAVARPSRARAAMAAARASSSVADFSAQGVMRMTLSRRTSRTPSEAA